MNHAIAPGPKARAIFAAKTYRAKTDSLMLDGLNLSVDMVVAHSFVPIDANIMACRIKRQLRLISGAQHMTAAVRVRAGPSGRQDHVDVAGNGLRQMCQKLPCSPPVGLIHELGGCKLSGQPNTHKEMELALRRLNLGKVPFRQIYRANRQPGNSARRARDEAVR